jgi:branched-chain amino acid transport system ATP-binding protein
VTFDKSSEARKDPAVAESANLELAGVSAGYGVVGVLREVSLHVASGEIVAVLGANGAGKTTLLKTAVGLLSPTSGTITAAGIDATKLSTEEITRLGVVLVPEGRQLFYDMTVRENLLLGGFTHRRDRSGRDQAMERVTSLFPVLGERMNSMAAQLSGGQQQMVAVGRALMGRPSILLMDEPSLGLAPLVTKEMFEVFQTLREGGVTLLIVEQQALMTLELADRAYVLERGRIIASGPSSQLIDDPSIRSSYLGLQIEDKEGVAAIDRQGSNGAGAQI